MSNPIKPKGTYKDFVNNDASGKIFVFELMNKNPQGATMSSKETGKVVPFPMSFPIPCVGTVFEKKGDKTYPRKIRYVVGENSIYVDEQSNDKDFPKVKVMASFVNGRIEVDGDDTPRLNFFMKWDINATNPNRDTKKEKLFKLVDTSVLATAAREKSKVEFDVMTWCHTADFRTKIRPLAALFFTDEQMVQNSEDIRWNLEIMAKRNPQMFKDMLDNPITERKIIIKRAIIDGHIVINVVHNAIAWAQNPSAPFTVASPGTDVIEDFANKSKSGDGQKYYDAIYNLVNPSVQPESKVLVEQVKKEEVNLSSQIKSASENDAELIAIIDKAIEMKIITKSTNNVWFKYRDESRNSKEKFVELLRSNPIILKILKGEIGL